MEKIIVQTKAREFLRSRRVTTFPVDADQLAQSVEFQVVYRDLPDDESGFCTVKAGKKILCINKNHDPKRQRFTIFHEIAHDWLKLPSNHGAEASVPVFGSYARRPEEEIACDIFAAECLLPWALFQPFVEEESFTLDTIDYLSDEFLASRTCVASRFADQSPELHAYILSEDGKIVYAACSKLLKELKYWISVGTGLPRESAAQSIRVKKEAASKADYGAYVWSSSDIANAYYCEEEAFYLPKWDQTVSLLTFDRVNKEEEEHADDTDYDSELLPELTGYLPWKKR